MLVRLWIPPRDSLLLKPLLDRFPNFVLDDGGMQSVVHLPLMAQSADVDRVRQNPIKMATREGTPARTPSRATDADGRRRHLFVESGLEPNDAAEFQVPLE